MPLSVVPFFISLCCIALIFFLYRLIAFIVLVCSVFKVASSMGVMPFLATCHSCERCIVWFLFVFQWRIKFSLSLSLSLSLVFSDIWYCNTYCIVTDVMRFVVILIKFYYVCMHLCLICQRCLTLLLDSLFSLRFCHLKSAGSFLPKGTHMHT